MGSCFSKKATTATTTLPPAPQNSDHHQPPNTIKNDQPVFKKEIFVIKHRISHEIDRHSNQESDKNPSATTSTTGARPRTPSCSKEELDAILVQCDKLSRSNSSGAQNPSRRRRRHSRSKRSFDSGFDTNAGAKNEDIHNDIEVEVDADDEDDALDHHHRHRHRNRQAEVRVSSSGRYSSKERRISISPSRGSSSKDRRISISPSRRSESPFSNKNSNSTVAGGGGGSSSSNRPAKMVSVPATDKGSNAGVKRIHVKRNVSPARARTSIQVFSDDRSEEQESSSREADRRRKSLVEIDNNACRGARTHDTKRTRRLSRDLDMNPDTGFDPSLSQSLSPSPPSYASLLLEDIQNFHKKNTTNAATTQPSFEIPECVSKACLIMEAVADMNSNASSLCSDGETQPPPRKRALGR